jgi:hypothetical protein
MEKILKQKKKSVGLKKGNFYARGPLNLKKSCKVGREKLDR